MAIELKLVHSSTTLSLKAAADSGMRLSSAGWYPISAPMGTSNPVAEVIDLICDATSHDAMITDVQELEHMRYWARLYSIDPSSEDPVWLHAKMQNETGERRALVRSIEFEWLEPLLETDTGAQAENELRLRARIEREPCWEDTAHTIASGALSETAGTVLTFDYTAGGSPADVVGDLPARISFMRINSDASGANVGRLWIGLRSHNKHETLTSFDPIWECEDGTNNASESGITDDTTSHVNGASPGSGSGAFVILSESDLDWDTSSFLEVLELTLSDISSNEQPNFGDFLWLFRYKVAAGSCTWDVQLRWGYSGMDDDDFMRGPTVELSSTSWDYAELGRMPIPLRDHHALDLSYVSDNFEDEYAVQIWARRTSGSANLHLDCLCLIPIDEGWLKSWDFDLPAGSNADWVFSEGPLGDTIAAAYTGGSISHMASHASDRFRLPVGDGRMYIVYAGPSSHDLTVGISQTEPRYFERWGNLRGSE